MTATQDETIAELRAEVAALRERLTARDTAFDERAAHQQAATLLSGSLRSLGPEAVER